MAQDIRLAGGRVKEAGQHLERRGFTRPVRTQEPHELSFLNKKADVANRVNFSVFSMEKPFERAGQAGFFMGDLERFREMPRLDHLRVLISYR